MDFKSKALKQIRAATMMMMSRIDFLFFKTIIIDSHKILREKIVIDTYSDKRRMMKMINFFCSALTFLSSFAAVDEEIFEGNQTKTLLL